MCGYKKYNWESFSSSNSCSLSVSFFNFFTCKRWRSVVRCAGFEEAGEEGNINNIVFPAQNNSNRYNYTCTLRVTCRLGDEGGGHYLTWLCTSGQQIWNLDLINTCTFSQQLRDKLASPSLRYTSEEKDMVSTGYTAIG